MADKSSYLRFLPPMLWQGEPDAPEFSLGAALRIFEKILTGIDDGVPIRHFEPDGTPREHDPIGEVIGRLHRLFDPWSTPPEFLPWLASWVSLEFPGDAIWDEHLRRKATSEIAQIYRKRGLKAGLDEYLDLYTASDKRPRVTVDDGARLLVARPVPGRFAPVDSLIGHGPVSRSDRSLVHGGLVHPQCIARAPDGMLFVGDTGAPTYWNPPVDKSVWAIPVSGRHAIAGAPPQPQRIGPKDFPPRVAIAVAVDRQAPWRVFVLVGAVAVQETALYSLRSPGFKPTRVATKAQLGVVNPVAMSFDANGHLLILDAGHEVSPPKVVDVQITPLVCTDHPLDKVLWPLSLAVLESGPGGGDLIIGDGREQDAPTVSDLVRVNRAQQAWVESRLLEAVPAGGNPLVAPTAVVELQPNRLLVLDAGLKPLAPSGGDPYTREIAEPAALYWVDLAQPPPAPPVVTRASEMKSLVAPSGMVSDGENVFICDPGEPEDVERKKPRALGHEFAVIVHFSRQRPVTDAERQRIVENIRDIVDRGKPAHTLSTVIS